MKSRPKQPTVPQDRPETLRHQIVDLLHEGSLTARELSGQIGISEKEVLGHLEKLKTALHGELSMEPALCLACGFEFRKRERVKAPGRCPVCRSERITEPRFTIE